MTSKDLHFEMRGTVAVIRLSRPAKRNALGDALILALRNQLDALPPAKASAVFLAKFNELQRGLT